jgi:PmbA protein
MSRHTVDDLQAIADAIVAEAREGEQIAASVTRSTETDVRVRNGEVEHFVSAQSQSLGITVIQDGRTGNSSARMFDEASWREVLAEARENASFGSVDEFAGLAEPDGVEIVEQKLWDRERARAFSSCRRFSFAY